MLKLLFTNSAVVLLLLILCSCEKLDMNESGNLVPQTVAENSDIPSLEINGTLLHVEDFGNPDSTVVIFLHGGPGGNCNDFTPYRALVNSGYRVVQWDQRGTGLSERLNTCEIGTEMYLEDLRQIIDHFAPNLNQKVVLFGHSWGGMYATFFIDSYGDYNGKIAGAILSEVGGFTSQAIQDYLDQIIGGLKLNSESFNDALWKQQFFTPSEHASLDYPVASMEADAERRLEHNVTPIAFPEWPKRRGEVVSSYYLNHVVRKQGFDWTKNLKNYSHKVLFLRGSLNELMPLSHQQELATHYPTHEIITVEDTGHDVLNSKFNTCLEIVSTYLKEIN